MKHLGSAQEASDWIGANLGPHVRLATPLGLGKPNVLLNLLYEKAKSDPSLKLTIYTALSLSPPHPSDELAKRFLGPFRDRHWGKDYPDLAYARDAARGKLPPNIRVHEFYFQAGAALRSDQLQRDHQSINYTHVAESLVAAGVQVIVQLVAKGPDSANPRFSLSCNPDLTLDAVDLFRQAGKPIVMVGVVHPDLPFLKGEAEVGADFFDVLVEDPGTTHQLFALPRMPINEVDHMIGFHVSQLVADDGTLQIGIGSLSDAVVSSLILRQKNNALYRELAQTFWRGRETSEGLRLEVAPFAAGLYGLSEMLNDGFMHLRRAGCLARHVIDERSHAKTYLHGAFFLGSKEFYAWLRGLQGDDFSGLRMSRVSKVNDLYDPNEILLRVQRKNARFINTCMQVTLLGGAASETLEDGRVVSGVGGQYNFVAMSMELKGARSVLMLRSAREETGIRHSNIVWSHGQLTIPRHLRDIVVTEYGIADLRAKTDEDTIIELLKITDSQFQAELMNIAKRYGKLRKDYELPEWAKANTPATVRSFIEAGRSRGHFKNFPFGSDFTAVEERLAAALSRLQAMEANPALLVKLELLRLALPKVGRNFLSDLEKFHEELERMGLDRPRTLSQRFYRRLIVGALRGFEGR